ncbi:MAG: hypothetical protein A2X94_02580 [Bdellovibrionales bacterium GWB1_55_8]|nr:MAG: hypothetical protein A2X94_02580 [Bdellovibrionales bacterium GWB1_55_8]
MKGFSKFILRRAGWVAFVGTLVSIVAAYYSVQLYKNLRTDISELLPNTARSVLDLDEVSRRLESIDNLAILIFSENADAAKKFQSDLARKLEQVPKNVLASVEYKIDRELKFFEDRKALYIDLPDLIRVRNYIEDRIEYERELYNPLNIFREDEIPEPALDFNALRGKYDARLGAYTRLPGGYYSTAAGTLRVILAYMPGKTSSIKNVHALKDAVLQAVEELNPVSYSEDLRVRYAGGVQDILEEHLSLIADLELSTVIVTAVVTLSLFVFFRSWVATIALTISLIFGTFWTFGFSYFVVGYLNANTAFLGSIVLGNGINFGIMMMARYFEERRAFRSHGRAMQVAMTHTATATGAAALAAGLAYGSLMLTQFRGFNQFGVIGLVGMIFCWISAFTLLPAFLTIWNRFWPIVPRSSQSRVGPERRALLTDGLAKTVEAYPGTITIASLALTLIAATTFIGITPDSILETDMSRLRNKESMTTGSGSMNVHLNAIFNRYLSPLVFLPDKREDAREIAEKLKQKKAEQGADSMIASVQMLDDFVPRDQLRKIEILRDIRRTLPQKIVQRLSEHDQKLVSQFLSPAAMRPIHEKDLPPLVLNKFTEKDKTIGKMVLIEPPLGSSTWKGARLVGFIDDLREVADSVGEGIPLAGTLAITSDMIRAISRDGPRATLFAFLAVVGLIFILFRDLKTVSLVLFALVLGSGWLAGLMLGFELKVNFLNFIALPITFGIGVDYGVNMFQRYKLEGGGSILKVIRNTGGPVGLCSFTTAVGYGSLLLAGNQGFVSFGTLAVAGEVTCVIAAVVSLPAFLYWQYKRGLQK